MRPAVSVTPDTLERAALRLLLETRIPGMLIVDGEEHFVGFDSDGHLLASVLPRYMAAMQDYVAVMEDLSFVREGMGAWVRHLAESADRPVRDVMSSEVLQMELGRSEVTVADKMVHDGASSVGVTENDKLVGIANRLDLYATVLGIETDQGTK